MDVEMRGGRRKNGQKGSLKGRRKGRERDRKEDYVSCMFGAAQIELARWFPWTGSDPRLERLLQAHYFILCPPLLYPIIPPLNTSSSLSVRSNQFPNDLQIQVQFCATWNTVFLCGLGYDMVNLTNVTVISQALRISDLNFSLLSLTCLPLLVNWIWISTDIKLYQLVLLYDLALVVLTFIYLSRFSVFQDYKISKLRTSLVIQRMLAHSVANWLMLRYSWCIVLPSSSCKSNSDNSGKQKKKYGDTKYWDPAVLLRTLPASLIH